MCCNAAAHSSKKGAINIQLLKIFYFSFPASPKEVQPCHFHTSCSLLLFVGKGEVQIIGAWDYRQPQDTACSVVQEGFVGMWRELGRCQVVQVNDSTTASHLHVKYWWAPARAADVSSWRQFHPWTCTRLCSDAMREAWGGWAQQSTELCATTTGCLTPWMDPGEMSVFGGRERGSGEAQQQQFQLDSGIIFSPS